MNRYRLKSRGSMVLLGALALLGLAGGPERADANDTLSNTASASAVDAQLAHVRGELAATKARLDRAQAVLHYSTLYKIPADLSAAIHDIARAEGIDPDIGFRLVRVESGFRRDAVSPMGAIGYTQIRLPTARTLDPRVTERDLRRRDVNLRLGFRYLRHMLETHDHDMTLALLAYNRGPGRVQQILAEGGDPRNGYARTVLEGYRR
jgi:soluble lytic murein transglycosylase-like protein